MTCVCVCGDQLSHCDMVVVVVHDFQTVVFLPTPLHLFLVVVLCGKMCGPKEEEENIQNHYYDKRMCVPDEKHPLVSLY